ncbi:CDP-diacylglycerol--glycerol-3-phosphate 3-phosphatidyltransferase [Guggenheimella bovis]
MNTPNKLTVLRMILVPIYAVVLFTLKEPVWALLIFLVASFTDFLDGYLARKMNLITDFGKFMDPLADKLLTITAFVIFSKLDMISIYVVLVIIARELMISVFRAIAAGKQVVLAAGKSGKLKTVFQILTIIGLSILQILGQKEHVVTNVLIILTLLLTLYSGTEYILKNKSVLEEK